jgi:hypothetical protein
MPLPPPITLLAAATLSVASSVAEASPYETGSLDPAEHFELKTVFSGKAEGAERAAVAPSFELAIPARDDLELNVTIARAVVRDADRVVHSGFADAEMGAKWAVFRQGQNDHAFGLTVEPTLVTPTGADRVSDHAWALEVPVTAGRSFGRFELEGELAYEHVFNGDADEVGVSGVFQFEVSDTLEIGTELAGSAAPSDLGAAEWRLNLGFKQALTPYLELHGLIGRSLTTEAGRHLTQAKLVVEYAFH